MRPVILCLALLIASFDCAPSQTPTLPQIVQNYLTARGGLERIKAVRSIIFLGPDRGQGNGRRYMVKARPNYFIVGNKTGEWAEGFDGAAWEFYADPGLVLRVTDAPGAALRHTSYFDDPLVYFGETGWKFELIGKAVLSGDSAYDVRATYPDGNVTDNFISSHSWLLIAARGRAPIHAFGAPVTTETLIGKYVSLNGALFPTSYTTRVLGSSEPTDDGTDWEQLLPNVPMGADYFSPPSEPNGKLPRMLNALYRSRYSVSDALRWFHDFKTNPVTAQIDTEAGIEAIGYQCLKNGAVETGIALLEENLAAHPRSAEAMFGLGRAYRTAGMEAKALQQFHAALSADPNHKRAAAALADSVNFIFRRDGK